MFFLKISLCTYERGGPCTLLSSCVLAESSDVPNPLDLQKGKEVSLKTFLKFWIRNRKTQLYTFRLFDLGQANSPLWDSACNFKMEVILNPSG